MPALQEPARGPCGCGLRTSEPRRLCACYGKHRSAAHWDEQRDVCDGCSWCGSLEHDPCCHGSCYAPIAEGDPDAPA